MSRHFLPCFVCGRVVLGIRGQDATIDPAYLESGDELLQAKAVGPCHLRCLVESPWGEVWARRICDHMVGPGGRRPIGEHEDWAAMINERTGSLVGVRKDGLMVSIEAHELGGARPIEGGWLNPQDHPYHLHLPDQVAALDEAKRELKSHGRYRLLSLLEALGILDRQIFPQALESGVLRFDKKLAENWEETWLSARWVYATFIPAAAMELLRKAVP